MLLWNWIWWRASKLAFILGPYRGHFNNGHERRTLVSPQCLTVDLEMSASPKPAERRHPLLWKIRSPSETQEDQEKQGTRGLHTLLQSVLAPSFLHSSTPWLCAAAN